MSQPMSGSVSESPQYLLTDSRAAALRAAAARWRDAPPPHAPCACGAGAPFAACAAGPPHWRALYSSEHWPRQYPHIAPTVTSRFPSPWLPPAAGPAGEKHARSVGRLVFRRTSTRVVGTPDAPVRGGD